MNSQQQASCAIGLEQAKTNIAWTARYPLLARQNSTFVPRTSCENPLQLVYVSLLRKLTTLMLSKSP